MKVYLVTEIDQDHLYYTELEFINPGCYIKTFATHDLARKYVEQYIKKYFPEEDFFTHDDMVDRVYITDQVNGKVTLLSIEEQEVITSEEGF